MPIVEISFDDAVGLALDSLLNDRLAVLCGAGLSMSPPSSLPNAATLAAAAKTKYEAIYGATRPPLPCEIEDQAEYFFQRGELATVYLRSLIGQDVFAGPPNEGHAAVADLLLVRGIQTAVTTNVDTLIETAGQLIFGRICGGIDERSVAICAPERAPLLKLHGCNMRDPDNTIWAPGQLNVAPFAERIANSEHWLRVRLLDRDLIIVGYWTDWDYLNQVLAATLGQVRPSKVIVVNPDTQANFTAKAPELYALGERAAVVFNHVRCSGEEFLAALRREFSKSFVRRVLHAGINEYQAQSGNAPQANWIEPIEQDNAVLWYIRRDLEGCLPHEPSVKRAPEDEPLLGLTLLQLQAAGAVVDGSYWVISDQRVRVLRAPNQPLHRIQSAFERETPPAVAPDIVIAVGAETQPLPPSIARGAGTPSIARGSGSRWMSRSDAIEELNL